LPAQTPAALLCAQTGAGKTYTMLGPATLDLTPPLAPETWAMVGVVPRAMADLFEVSGGRSA